MMLEDYKKALTDAQQSISLDETFVKGYLRAAKCQTMLGDPDLSIVWYDKALQLQPRNKQALEEVRRPCVVVNIIITMPCPHRKNKWQCCSSTFEKPTKNS